MPRKKTVKEFQTPQTIHTFTPEEPKKVEPTKQHRGGMAPEYVVKFLANEQEGFVYGEHFKIVKGNKTLGELHLQSDNYGDPIWNVSYGPDGVDVVGHASFEDAVNWSEDHLEESIRREYRDNANEK